MGSMNGGMWSRFIAPVLTEFDLFLSSLGGESRLGKVKRGVLNDRSRLFISP